MISETTRREGSPTWTVTYVERAIGLRDVGKDGGNLDVCIMDVGYFSGFFGSYKSH